MSYTLGNIFLFYTGFFEEQNPNPKNQKASLFFDISIGAVLLSLALILLSLVGFIIPTLFYLIAIFSIFYSIKNYKNFLFLRINCIKNNTTENKILYLYILIILFLSFSLSLTPTTQSDALRYHIPIPAMILQHQGFFFNPYNAFFQFPAGINMFYIIGYYFGDTAGPKLIHWFYLILTLILMGKFRDDFFPKSNIKYIQAIYVSTPFIPILSGWAFIDTGLTFYVLLSIYLICRVIQCGRRSEFMVLGLVLGFLAASKYSMLGIIPILILLLIYGLWKKNNIKIIRNKGLIFIIFFLLIATPWYLKNYIFTGNPVYPMGYSIFGGEFWSENNALFYQNHAQAKGGLNEARNNGIFYRLVELIYLPVKASFNPVSFELESARNNAWLYSISRNRIFLPDNFGDWQLGPIYLILMPILIIFLVQSYRNRYGEDLLIYNILLIFLFWYYLFWSASYRDNRFLLPNLPVLSIFLGTAITCYRWRLVRIIFYIILIYNLIWTGQIILREHNPYSFIMGAESRENYLRRNLNYYPAFNILNKINNENKPVLLIGEYRPLYLDGIQYSGDYFDTPVIYRILQNAYSFQDILDRLGEMQIGFILYNENELSKYLPDFARHFQSNQEWELYQQLIRYISSEAEHIIYVERGISDWEVTRMRRFLNIPDRDPRKIYIKYF